MRPPRAAAAGRPDRWIDMRAARIELGGAPGHWRKTAGGANDKSREREAVMKLIDHAHITSTDVELEAAADGTLYHILIVQTDLPLIASEPNYDEASLTSMLKDIQSWIRTHTSFHRARIRHQT